MLSGGRSSEAMEEALTPEEIERFTAHLRPLVENRQRRGTSAVVYLSGLSSK